MMYSFMTESRQLVQPASQARAGVRFTYPTVADALVTLRAQNANGPGGPSA